MMPVDWWEALNRFGYASARGFVTLAWQSAILFVAVGLLAWALRKRRASVRHALWVAALVAAPLLPFVTDFATRAGVPQAAVSVMPAYRSSVARVPEPSATRQAEADETAPVEIGRAADVGSEEHGYRTEAVASGTPAHPARQPDASPLSYPWAIALALYAAGIVAMLVWHVLGRIRVHQWIGNARPITDRRVLSAFRQARQRTGLHKGVLVLASARIPAPLACGLVRQVILLPEGLAQRLSDEELQAVAVHETAHVARRDPLVLGLVSLIRAGLFLHPLVWLAARRVAVLAEHAADDAVLSATGEAVGYARMLARLAEDLPRRSLSTEAAVGFVFCKSAFLRRVEAILSEKRTMIRRLSKVGAVGIGVAFLLAVALAATMPLGEASSEPKLQDAALAQRSGDLRRAPTAEEPAGATLSPAGGERGRADDTEAVLEVLVAFRDALIDGRFKDAANLLHDEWVDIWGQTPEEAVEYLRMYALTHLAARQERLDEWQIELLGELVHETAVSELREASVRGRRAVAAACRTKEGSDKEHVPWFFYALIQTNEGWKICERPRTTLARAAFLQGNSHDDATADVARVVFQFMLDLSAARYDRAKAFLLPSRVPLLGSVSEGRAEVLAIEKASNGQRLSFLDDNNATNFSQVFTSSSSPFITIGNRGAVVRFKNHVLLVRSGGSWRIAAMPRQAYKAPQGSRTFPDGEIKRMPIRLDLETGRDRPDWHNGMDIGFDEETSCFVLPPDDMDVRLLALPDAMDADSALSMASGRIPLLETSDARQLKYEKGRFFALRTSEGYYALVEMLGESEGIPEIRWWYMAIPSPE